MKKSLAILLSLALILCMIPSTAFAVETPVSDTEPVTLTADMVNVTLNSEIYTGSTITSTVSVNVTGKSPVLNTDYTVEYEPAEIRDAREYKVTVTSKAGNVFKNATSVEKTFTVAPVDFNKVEIKYTGNKVINAGSTAVETIKTDNVTVKQNGTDVPKNFYDILVAEKSNNPNVVIITVKPKSVDGKNVIGGDRDIEVTLKTNLESNYKIVSSTSSGEIPNQVYDAMNPPKPSIYVVSINGSQTLSENTDYKISYENNNKAGTATVKVTAAEKGNYYGTLTKEFTIEPKSLTKVSIVANNTIKGERPELTVVDGNKALKVGIDYNYKNWKTDTVGTNKGSVTIEGVSNGNYKDSVTKTFNVIDSKNVFNESDVTFGSLKRQYNGSEQKVDVTVKIKVWDQYQVTSREKTLTEGYDYKVEYISKKDNTKTSSAKNAGEYDVIVSGIGSYSGTVKTTLTIDPAPLDYAEIVLGSSSVLYDGVYVPKVSVIHKYSRNYFPESDYTVSYRYLKFPSLEPLAVVVPKEGGNLTAKGSKLQELTAPLRVGNKSIYNCNVYFTDYRSSKQYDGKSNFKPSVTVKDYSYNIALRENIDYKVIYKNSKGKEVSYLRDAGTYSVIVEGIGAYSGTQTLTYTIYGTDISGYTVTLRESSVNYDGRSHMPSIVSVKKGYYSSLSSNDYTVTYEGPDGKEVSAYNIKNSGTYKVIVTGKNGYSGSIYAEYRIIGKPQTVTVTGKPSGKIYATSDTFKLTGYATGAGSKVTYSSSNPSVASVSSLGYVTPKKVGKTVITVSTYGDTSYEPATKEVTIVISPKKAVLTQKPWTSGQKKLFKVRWNYQEGANRYQIMYSQDKSFKKGTYKLKSVNAHNLNAATQSTAVKGLKSGKRYYVKVRAIYQDKDYRGRVIKNYWGTWSNWRSVVVK